MEQQPIGLIIMIVRQLLKLISPHIREYLEKILPELEAKAKATPNPWDDILVAILKVMFVVE